MELLLQKLLQKCFLWNLLKEMQTLHKLELRSLKCLWGRLCQLWLLLLLLQVKSSHNSTDLVLALSVGVVAGIVAGAAATVAVLGSAVAIYIKKRTKDTEPDSIPVAEIEV